MAVSISRRVEVTAVSSENGHSWSMWVVVKVAVGATDTVVRNAALREALKLLDKENIATRSVAVSYIVPLDD